MMPFNHTKQLYIVEDQDGRSDIWEASLTTNAVGYSTSVKLFGTNTASGSEATGIYFKPSDVSTLYVNVQHPTSTNDLTMAISKI
jgi:secreted PhoX family phosphatase